MVSVGKTYGFEAQNNMFREPECTLDFFGTQVTKKSAYYTCGHNLMALLPYGYNRPHNI